MSSSSLGARDLAVFWHPCSQMGDYRDFPPLEIASAEGTRLRLVDGREILDAISSWWCKSLGHGHPGVRARITTQLNRLEHVIAANTTHESLVELCERLLALANGARPAVPHFGKVFFAENGSTAVEIALKMALQAQAQRGQTLRTRFAALSGGYHGETVAALSVGDLGLYADPFHSMMFPVHKLRPIPYRSGPDDPAWQIADAEWRAIEAELAPMGSELAAIIYEPILQAAGGMRLHSPALLRHLRRFATEHGVYLIADEIAAGMGRLGRMLATELSDPPRQDVACKGDAGNDEARGGEPGSGASPADESRAIARPDFLVLGKGLTAGFLPLAAVLTTDDVYAAFYSDRGHARAAFLHSNTHTANALTLAAALGALDAYATEGILDQVAAQGPYLAGRMRELARSRRSLANVRALGMMAAGDVRAPGGDALAPEARTGYRIYREAVRRGALLRPIGDTMYLFPPLNSSRAELDSMLSILADSVDAIIR